MGRIKDNNYYVTNGWMINRLGLSGRELQVYAIIYGFTQDGETEFSGSLTYLMEWLNVGSKHTVIKAIDALIKKGLVEKRQQMTDKGPVNYYITTKIASAISAPGAVQKVHGGSAESAQPPSAESAPGAVQKVHPIINSINNSNNNKDNLLVNPPENDPEKSDPVPYKRIQKMYNEMCSFSKCISLSENRKKALAARWKEYGGKLETFETLFREAEKSDFLKGKNDRNWSASFDWLIKSDNMAKVLEGKYKNKEAAGYGINRPGAARAAAGYGKPAAAAADVRTTAELEAKIREQGGRVEYPDFGAIVGK
jgi:DNA-binding MarR family transcriptional regulator